MFKMSMDSIVCCLDLMDNPMPVSVNVEIKHLCMFCIYWTE